MNYKKITRSQKIGIDGETFFAYYSSSILNILSTKINNDFGIDFIGQLIGEQLSSNTHSVLPKFVGFFIRTTENDSNPYSTINKADAELFLKSEFPLIFTLLHKKNNDFNIAFYFQNDTFIQKLIKFINDSGKDSLTIYFKKCISDITSIKQYFNEMYKPNYIDKIKAKIKKNLVTNIFPNSNLKIIHYDDNSFALIEFNNSDDQFDLTTNENKKLFMQAAFGDFQLEEERLKMLPLNNNFFKIFDYLEDKIIFKFPTFNTGQIIKITSINNEKNIECEFEFRKTKTHYGYYHKSGLSLIISNRELHDENFVHMTTTQIDEQLNSTIFEHQDLCDFLENCINPNTHIKFNENFNIPAKKFNLQVYGWLIKYLRSLKDNPYISSSNWKLKCPSEEDLQSLKIITELTNNISYLNKYGVIIERSANRIQEEAEFTMPLCMNLNSKGIICWLNVKGNVFRDDIDRSIIGLQIIQTNNIKYEVRDNPFPTKGYPEFKFGATIPSFSIYKKQSFEINAVDDDWNAEVIFNN